MSDPVLLIAARLLIGLLFVAGGIKHFFIASVLVPMIAARGLPWPQLVLYAGTCWQIACGVLFMVGALLPWSAGGLILFTLLASIMLLNFWDLPAGPTRNMLQNQWLSNLAVIGGILATLAATV